MILNAAAHEAARREPDITPFARPRALRVLVIAAGLGWSVLFIVIGLACELQMYGDGSLFSYAIAVEDAWAFHWRNISGRALVYLYAFAPSEAYVALTKDARGGIALYGFLFFAAQFLGLIATFAADRSKKRAIFVFACASTACLCPLVFGFPTEMWMAHALFWPALALCHHVKRGMAGGALVFAALLALVLTHEGAVVLAVAAVATLFLPSARNPRLLRAAGALGIALAVWIGVKAAMPPDAYFGGVVPRAALNFVSLGNFENALFLKLFAALASYAAALCVLRAVAPEKAAAIAAAIVAIGLIAHWRFFDHALHAENRYYARTALLMGTPVFGALAVAFSLKAEDELRYPARFARWMKALGGCATRQAAAGAFLILSLVHVIETAKFVSAWSAYREAVQALATGSVNDPVLGDAHFVSSRRIGDGLERLSWSSTTHFLSVLLAPSFAPSRLVVDPDAGYFWLSCKTAAASEQAKRAVPTASRRLIRVHACLHR